MAGIGEIRPQVPLWPIGEVRVIKPTGGQGKATGRQPNKEQSDKGEPDEDDTNSTHIDEYV